MAKYKMIEKIDQLQRELDEKDVEMAFQVGHARKNAILEFIENLIEVLDEEGIDYYELCQCIDRVKEEMNIDEE